MRFLFTFHTSRIVEKDDAVKVLWEYGFRGGWGGGFLIPATPTVQSAEWRPGFGRRCSGIQKHDAPNEHENSAVKNPRADDENNIVEEARASYHRDTSIASLGRILLLCRIELPDGRLDEITGADLCISESSCTENTNGSGDGAYHQHCNQEDQQFGTIVAFHTFFPFLDIGTTNGQRARNFFP